MVTIKNISKNYNKVEALKNISISIKKGELFGLIGPDGAGKTTLLRIIISLLIPDSGFANVFGYDVVKDYKEIRQISGYMPGRFSLYQDLTVEENLSFFATVFNTTIKENYDLIKDIYIQIEPFKNRRAGKLSGGMKQKLALSCALIHKPKILVLDEPTTGVDAVSRKEFWEMLKRLKQKDITIIVSTPYMDEASLCDRVALIQKGEIMSVNTPENIINQYSDPLFAVQASNMYALINDFRNAEFTKSAHLFGRELHFSPIRKNVDESIIKDFLQAKNHTKISVQKINANIEDCFMDLMLKR